MKFIKNLFFLLLLTTVSVSFGQLRETLFKGTLVLTNGQTKEGFIKNQSVSEYAKEVKFKTAETDKKFESFTSQTLKSFTTQNGHSYETITIKVNNNKDEVTVIAQKILTGKASLYLTYYETIAIYVVENNGVFYVLQKDELITGELQMTRYNFRGVLNMAIEGYTGGQENLDYDGKTFINLITGYNQTKDSESTILVPKEKAVKYFTVYGGYANGTFETDRNLFFQSNFRVYFPSISRTTSINIGLNYISGQFNNTTEYSYKTVVDTYSRQLISVPFTVQQNFATKSWRPYIFGGFGFANIKLTDDKNSSIIDKGFQRDSGFSMVYGAGMELDLYKGITTKVEYRSELHSFYLIGIGYNFMK